MARIYIPALVASCPCSGLSFVHPHAFQNRAPHTFTIALDLCYACHRIPLSTCAVVLFCPCGAAPLPAVEHAVHHQSLSRLGFCMIAQRSHLLQWLVENLNFFRIHVLFFLIAPLVSAVIFWAGQDRPFTISFIDSLFICVSSITCTGLSYAVELFPFCSSTNASPSERST